MGTGGGSTRVDGQYIVACTNSGTVSVEEQRATGTSIPVQDRSRCKNKDKWKLVEALKLSYPLWRERNKVYN